MTEFMLRAACLIVLFGIGYVAAGALVAPFLVFRGLRRFGRVRAGIAWGFKVMVLPDAILSWLLLFRRNLAAKGMPPIECLAR